MTKVSYKTEEDIIQLRETADMLSRMLGEIAKEIKPGVQTISLDKLAYTYIKDHGAEPAFLGYHDFPYTLCISVNDQVVHGFPSNYELKDGDIISVDGGIKNKGYVTDSAYTFGVGELSPEVQQLLQVTKDSLEKGIEKAIVGNRVGDISSAVQDYVTPYGYGIVRELVGHGVGYSLHEKPEIPNYGKRGSGMKLEEGLVICIEPMINLGKQGVKFWDDGWTVSTIDGKPSAHFEKMVVVRKGKPEVLTNFEHIENVLIKNS